MNEKIVLTVEQGEAIENFKEQNDSLEYLARRKVEHSDFKFMYKAFNDMTLEEIAKAIYAGYEVEQPKFKIDDLVMHTKGAFKGAKHITHVNHGGFVFVEDVNDVGYLPSSVRHATKEEAFWDEMGREVGEFKDGDRIIFKDESSTIIDSVYPGTTDFVKKKYENDRVKGYYPANSFIEFP